MTTNQRALLGVGYLVVVALLVSLSVGIYNKAMPWQETVPVTLTTATPGLELNPQSDVKLQGVRVGEVREVTTDGRRATVHIALDPDKVELIPANVDAVILPKTLFGEKYVDLRAPASPAEERIGEDDVIRQSRNSVEIGQLFNRLVPILRTLRPEQVSTLLSETAEALRGQGKALGEAVGLLATFSRELRPSLDTLAHDVEQFADVADIYADVTPQLMRVLGNSAAISRDVLVPEEKDLASFLDSVVTTSDTTSAVLEENSQALITLNGRARPVLQVLDRYAESLGCLLGALHIADIGSNQVVGARGPISLLTVDMVVTREPYHYPDDLPTNPKSDAHPSSLPPWVPSFEPHCARPPSWVLGLKNVGPGELPTYPGLPAYTGGDDGEKAQPRAARRTPDDAALAEARAALARAIAGQELGVPADRLPAYAELLLTPMLTEGEVSVR